MYSVTSSGNSTLSCNADQRCYLLNVPELLGYTGSAWRVRVQALLKPFNWSSSLCQTSCPIVNSPLRSTIERCLDFPYIVKSYCSISSSTNWNHVAVIWSRNLSGLISNQLLFTNRNRNGRQCHSGHWSWLCFRNKFPCNSVLNVFKRNGFWLFGYVCVNSIHNSNPRNCSVSKQVSTMISIP